MNRVFAILGFVMLAGLDASAASRSYSLPIGEGQAISACLADGATCGKPAADQFCKLAGFEESILFARAPVASAHILDSELTCAGTLCEAFTQIKCYSPKVAEQVSTN